MSARGPVLLATSYPDRPGDAADHFVAEDARQRGAGHVLVPATAGRPVGLREEAGIVVEALPAHELFGWPGAWARLREAPLRIVGAPTFLRAARRRLAALVGGRAARRPVVAHWAVPMGLVASSLGAPQTLVSHGGDVRALCTLPRPLRAALVEHLTAGAIAWEFVAQPLLDALVTGLPPRAAERLLARAVIRPAPLQIPTPEPTAVAAIRARGLAGARGPLWVSVGRLVATKRIDRALAAAAAAGARLVILGDGPEEPALRALAARGASDALFLGRLPREETLRWIAAADALVFASEAEGLSTVLREATALGTPILDLTKGTRGHPREKATAR